MSRRRARARFNRRRIWLPLVAAAAADRRSEAKDALRRVLALDPDNSSRPSFHRPHRLRALVRRSLPRTLRPYLLRLALSPAHALATDPDVIAVAALLARGVVPDGATLIAVATLGAVGARVWLWAWPKLAPA